MSIVPRSLEETIAIKNRQEKAWLALPGVSGVDVGSHGAAGQPASGFAIRIYVANKASLPPPLQGLQEVEGVPVHIIERSFQLH